MVGVRGYMQGVLLLLQLHLVQLLHCGGGDGREGGVVWCGSVRVGRGGV